MTRRPSHLTIVGALMFASLTLPTVRAQSTSSSADDPIITIDGTKNPEMIPQWIVWRSAFGYLAKDDREQLPTVVVRAITHEQARALMQDAKAATTFATECANRVYQREMALWKEKPDLDIEAVNAKMTEGHIACRRHTLEVRDKVLADLSPTGAAALSGFVESLKNGWTAQMKKSYLKNYLLPK